MFLLKDTKYYKPHNAGLTEVKAMAHILQPLSCHVRDGAPGFLVMLLCALCWLVEWGLGPRQQQFIKTHLTVSSFGDEKEEEEYR